MKESVITFGPQGGLMGILSDPSPETQNPSRPALILLNAGLLNRTGPYRMYVDLARDMAEKGFTVLRFDFSGLGDSFTRKDNQSDEERAVLDVQEAMDHLTETKNIREFVLLGLCGGADRAHPLGIRDSRVKGIVYLDGFGYPTPGYYLRHYWNRVLHNFHAMTKLERWKHLLNRYYSEIFTKKIKDGAENPTETYVREFPTTQQFESDVRSMLDRGASLFFVYTDGIKYYNYEDQFRDAFKSLCYNDQLRVQFFRQTDHLFTSLTRRKELFQSISDWMQSQFSGNGKK
jgi:pimeloyl-ACP methyl ester carboxylesterase